MTWPGVVAVVLAYAAAARAYFTGEADRAFDWLIVALLITVLAELDALKKKEKG